LKFTKTLKAGIPGFYASSEQVFSRRVSDGEATPADPAGIPSRSPGPVQRFVDSKAHGPRSKKNPAHRSGRGCLASSRSLGNRATILLFLPLTSAFHSQRPASLLTTIGPI